MLRRIYRSRTHILFPSMLNIRWYLVVLSNTPVCSMRHFIHANAILPSLDTETECNKGNCPISPSLHPEFLRRYFHCQEWAEHQEFSQPRMCCHFGLQLSSSQAVRTTLLRQRSFH